jgi:hypothetical protein
VTAKTRWRYAIDSILHDIQEKRRTWSWEHISQIKRYRQAYINLYKKKKKLGEEKVFIRLVIISRIFLTLFLSSYRRTKKLNWSGWKLKCLTII